MVPTHDFEKFKKDCSKPGKVHFWGNVINDARVLFNLNTKEAVLDFISNDGLKELTHSNTTDLENNQTNKKILVDSYEFKTGNIFGYIAFFKGANKKVWIIKSFHHSHKMSQSKLMKSKKVIDALKKSGISKRDIRKLRGN